MPSVSSPARRYRASTRPAYVPAIRNFVRRRSNNSAAAIVVVALVVIVLLAYKTRQSLVHDPPRSSARSSQTEAVQARIGPQDIYPNSSLTPGATDPDISQDNIQDTICNPHWSTRSIRPPVHYTDQLKREQLREYGYANTNPRDYEEDHLIPLELGGNPTDPKNLWPEPYDASIPDGGAHAKDRVESYLHRQVCTGDLNLAEAQREIASDWYHVFVTALR
jgi:hypothetical protein